MKRPFIYHHVLMLLLICGYHCIAQEPYLKKYTHEWGLPSVKSYHILQDDKHFIWICSNSGVCRFDGSHVKTYVPQNSVCNYGAFHFLLDSSKRLWVISNQSGPVYFQNDSFHEYEGPFKNELKRTYWMLQDSRRNLYFLTNFSNLIVRLDQSGLADTMTIPNFSPYGELINDSTLITTSFDKVVKIINFKRTEYLSIKGYKSDQNRFFRIKNNLVIGSTPGKLFRFTDKDQRLLWEEPTGKLLTLSVHVEDSNTYWIGTSDGVYIFRYEKDELHLIKKMLPRKTVVSILKDHNGNYWIASADDAIYFINAANITYYALPEGYNNISQIAFTGSKGYLFSNNGNFSSLENGRVKQTGNITASKDAIRYYRVISTDSEVLVGYPSYKTGFIKNGKLVFPDNYRFENCYFRKDGVLFVVKDSFATGTPGMYKTVQEYRRGPGKTIGSFETKINLTFFHKNFCVDLSNNVWTGRNDTIICYEHVANGYRLKKIVKEGAMFAGMQCDQRNNVWIATKGAGILCLKHKKVTAVYNMSNGLLNNNCSSLHIDNDGNIWVCFENGLNKLELQQNGSYVIRSYTKNNFLPDAVINCVYKHRNKVYVGTANGLIVFEDNPAFLDDNFPNTCYITDVAVGGRDTSVLNRYELNFGTSLSLGFSAISYNQALLPVFHYKLEGADNAWNTTTSGKILYEHLNPGDYVFKVYANEGDKDGASILIHINPPFWKKWWFIALEVLLGLLCTGYICYLVIRSGNKRNELQRKIIENDLKSLRAQINPHFIFNALNSIQDYILDQQPRYANYYLTQFAKLMRMIVDNSRKETVSLSAEIHFLKLYLELEKLRLGASFEFEINAEDNINKDITFIPPMIIQPIAENSIKHGLAAKSGSKKLEILFRRRGNVLECTIHDNGIGRKKASEYNDQKLIKVSMGIENIKERLQLLNSRPGVSDNCIDIYDLYDEGERALGTRVTLLLPVFLS